MTSSLSSVDTSVLHGSIHGAKLRCSRLCACPSLSFQPLPPRRYVHNRSLRVATLALASASSSNNKNSLDDLAAWLVDSARSFKQKADYMFESAWLQTIKFFQSQDLKGRMDQSFAAANRKLEEFTYDACKGAQNFDRRFRVSERAQEMADFAGQQVKNIDEQLGLVKKFRQASTDLGRNWPMYRRRLDQFLQTPIGRLLTTIVFMWFLLSGWLFRIMLFSMWVLPLAAPLLISSAARNTIVEGACPSCQRRFIGNRNQMIVCNYCKAIVWQPRQDFSKGQSDPTIIDVDID